MSVPELKAALLGHPIAAADVRGITGVYRYALTGSPQNAAIPAELRGKFTTLTVVSADDIQFAFGVGAAPTIALNQASALGTGHVQAGKTVFSRIPLDRQIPLAATHLGWCATGGSGGYLEIECSELLG